MLWFAVQCWLKGEEKSVDVVYYVVHAIEGITGPSPGACLSGHGLRSRSPLPGGLAFPAIVLLPPALISRRARLAIVLSNRVNDRIMGSFRCIGNRPRRPE